MVIVGLVGFLRLRMKYDRLVSWLMFFAAAFLFIDFSGRLLNSGGEGFSFLWNTSQIGNITIDFHPEPKDAELLLPLFFISLITILHNNICNFEFCIIKPACLRRKLCSAYYGCVYNRYFRVPYIKRRRFVAPLCGI